MKIFPIFSAILLSLLIFIFMINYFYYKPTFRAAVITQDIDNIVTVLTQIDKDCSILKIENDENAIDFLSAKKTSGDKIGPLTLAYPQNWRGTYIFDDPTYQGKLYRMLKTVDGLFIVPGQDVVLPNNLTVGKDFQLSFKSKIFKMIETGGPLNYKGKAFAIKITFIIGDIGSKTLDKKKIEQINSVLEEFNRAMPFTHNQTTPYKC